MSHDVGTSSVLVSLLVAIALAAVGCSQSGSPEGPTAPPGTTDGDSADGGQASVDQFDDSLAPGAPDESEIKLATAESRVRPANDMLDESKAADPRLQPPGKLPMADAPLPLDDVDAADLTMPEVNLTEHHAAMCLVALGDKFPDLKLPDVEGNQQSLAELFGDKLTLVVFWHGREPTALEELADLARYHQPRFGQRGLAIVAINTGDQPQLAAELADQAGANFAVLSDADGTAFGQVATQKIPRTYLLDPAGTVLWLDLEYSPTALRDMVQAIRYSLAHE